MSHPLGGEGASNFRIRRVIMIVRRWYYYYNIITGIIIQVRVELQNQHLMILVAVTAYYNENYIAMVTATKACLTWCRWFIHLAVSIQWTGPLDWNIGLTFDPKYQLKWAFFRF